MFLLAGLVLLVTQACAQNPVSRSPNPEQAPFVLTELASLSLPFGSGVHGISALAADDASNRLIAFSDQGRVQLLELGFADDGTLIAANTLADQPMSADDGYPGDIESVTRLTDGGWLVGFERPHRLVHYPPGQFAVFSQRPDDSWSPPDSLSSFRPNEGIEAMTQLEDGQVLIISEGKRQEGHGLWIGTDGQWSESHYQTETGFAPVEAIRHPCGGVLVLERAANAIRGLTARLVHLSEAQIQKAKSGELVVTAAIGPVEPTVGRGNFEGMILRRVSKVDRACPRDIDLLFVTDDNKLRLLPRILAQYRLSSRP